jgi:WD40 repeat protein
LAVPDEKAGMVKVIHFQSEKKIVEIKAHNSSIGMLKLSQDGEILVTASEKGTLLRVFNTQSGEQINELRRGADQAVITDICIDPNNNNIACASDKGTIHIFSASATNDGEKTNKKSAWSALAGAVGYLGSNWSFAQFRVKHSSCKVAIIDNKIFAISKSGNYFMGDIKDGDIAVKLEKDLLEESGTQ